MAGNLSTPGVSVIERALALLFAFDEEKPRLCLTDLAQRTGLPLATAHRLVGQLVDGGALVRDHDGHYTVSRRMWKLGATAPSETRLREVAAPFLADLHAATRATVHLATREGDRALYLERLSGHTSVPVVSFVGGTLPLHSTGVGKILLAYAPADVMQQALGAMTRHTPYTITTPARLAEQLERVRRDGWASTAEEMTLGASSVAVPVRAGSTPGAPVIAALGVVVPNLRRDRDRLVTGLQIAARGISRHLAPNP